MTFRGRFSARRLVLGVGLCACVARVPRAAELARAPVTPRALGVGERIPGLRVFAREGDVVLENAEVIAVVRKRDGALVDFKRRRPVLPTSEQLLTTTDIDGVWDLLPVALAATGEHALPDSARVDVRGDRVETSSVLARRGGAIGARVRYSLDPVKPKLYVHASFHGSGPLPLGTDVGLWVRWGNVPYAVDAQRAPLTTFHGFVGWVGRAGAGGDLLLRAAAPAAFMAHFQSRARGFQGPLFAVAIRASHAPRNVAAAYELSYEPLPAASAPPSEPAAVPGRLDVDVRDEQQRPLASKLTLTRNGERKPVFPDDGGIDGADRFAWTGNGRIVCEPPPGRYEIAVTAGPEYTLSRHHVVIEPRTTARFGAVLRRVVPTPGWIAADLHLHQAPSVDADISLESRVIAVAAEGVELAVATDHYVVTDLAPVVRDLVASGALARPILTIAGTEVSTVGNRFGHFNVFPMTEGSNVEYENTTPSRLFASARRASPDGVLQVNHPRWDPNLGYFTRFDLDAATGLGKKPGYDPNFDLLEVYNGDDAVHLTKIEKVLADFLRLLGAGRRYVATGSSDSHKLAFLDPGLPRTLIAHGNPTRDDADARVAPADVLAALKAGRAIVTSGPVIEASVGDAGPGETARVAGRRAALHLRVRATPWISVSRVRVFEGPSGKPVHEFAVPKSEAVLRLDRTVPIELTGPTFVVVTAAGDTALPNASHDGVLPFAFTNPIWLEPGSGAAP